MTDSCVRAVIEAIHSTPAQAVLYLSGGGSQVIGWLTSVPGASNTVLEALVPYSRMSSIQLLGKIPSQFASQRTAEDMALLAYNRALKLSKPGCPAIGVGFTGSLATTHMKHGDHRVSAEYTPELNESDVSIETEKLFSEDEELEQLLNGQISFKVYPFSSGEETFGKERKIILPGSFNPLHVGHLKLLEVASSICKDGYPCFEISAVNADKPPLTLCQIKGRVKQFEKAGKTVIISSQPFFYKKAELFPGSAFVIGADTAVRLVNPKYYDGNYNKMIDILLGCKNTGCTFLVGGRIVDGAVKVLEDLEIPEVLKDMFISIPPEQFRMDISSTEIRKSRGL